ncbi:hypothetical protein [Nocardia sp. NPDC004711]
MVTSGCHLRTLRGCATRATDRRAAGAVAAKVQLAQPLPERLVRAGGACSNVWRLGGEPAGAALGAGGLGVAAAQGIGGMLLAASHGWERLNS